MITFSPQIYHICSRESDGTEEFALLKL